MTCVRWFSVAALVMPLWVGGQQPTTSLSIDALLAANTVSQVAPAPGGDGIAFVLARPASEGELYQTVGSVNARGDVWVIRHGRPAVKLTSAMPELKGFWQARWSPSGERLAMLTIDTALAVRIAYWDKRTNAVRVLRDHYLNLDPVISSGRLGELGSSAFAWLDDSTIVCAELIDRHTSSAVAAPAEAEHALDVGWRHAMVGDAPTGVVASHEPVHRSEYPSRLAAINVRTGVGYVFYSGNVVTALPAPNGRRVALEVDVGAQDIGHQPVLADCCGYRRYVVALVDRADTPLVHWVPRFETLGLSAGQSEEWSPDSRRLALIGRDSAAADSTVALWVVDGDSVVSGGKQVTQHSAAFKWMANGDLLVRGNTHGSYGLSGAETDRAIRKGQYYGTSESWNLVDAVAGRSRGIDMPSQPIAWRACEQDSTAYAAAGGGIWRLTAGALQATAIAMTDSVSIASISAIVESHGSCRIIAAGRIANDSVVLLDVEPDRPITAASRIRVAGGSHLWGAIDASDSDRVVVEYGDRDGAHLAIAGRSGSRSIYTFNAALAKIPIGRWTSFTYRGEDGDSLVANVLLPPGFQEGRRYPVVVQIYPGWDWTPSIDRDPPVLAPIPFEQMQLFGAQGFVTLLPSAPHHHGVQGETYLEIRKGVLPAIDKLEVMGIGDPSRLYLFGHSFGGYGVYSLLTQTRRFTAAVAVSAPGDLVSHYGEFNNQSVRYLPTNYGTGGNAAWSEGGQLDMGSPPSANLWKYLRDSPILYVDRVTTPLLIIQDEQDFVDQTQAEEWFTGLWRLGREVCMVRYLGEQHSVRSPANLRDYWRRVDQWFATHGTPGRAATCD